MKQLPKETLDFTILLNMFITIFHFVTATRSSLKKGWALVKSPMAALRVRHQYLLAKLIRDNKRDGWCIYCPVHPISYLHCLIVFSRRRTMPGELLPTMAAPRITKAHLSLGKPDLYLIVSSSKRRQPDSQLIQ
jgi:hypothetical protein